MSTDTYQDVVAAGPETLDEVERMTPLTRVPLPGQEDVPPAEQQAVRLYQVADADGALGYVVQDERMDVEDDAAATAYAGSREELDGVLERYPDRVADVVDDAIEQLEAYDAPVLERGETGPTNFNPGKFQMDPDAPAMMDYLEQR